jgi:hypothetical protein
MWNMTWSAFKQDDCQLQCFPRPGYLIDQAVPERGRCTLLGIPTTAQRLLPAQRRSVGARSDMTGGHNAFAMPHFSSLMQAQSSALFPICERLDALPNEDVPFFLISFVSIFSSHREDLTALRPCPCALRQDVRHRRGCQHRRHHQPCRSERSGSVLRVQSSESV